MKPLYLGCTHARHARTGFNTCFPMTPKIITTHVFPPIPIRSCDWSAHLDGQEENGPQGWGATEQDAIDDLNDQIEEDQLEQQEAKMQSEL